MSLDAPKSDAELLRLRDERLAQRAGAPVPRLNGVALGPNAPSLDRGTRASPRAFEHALQRRLFEWAWGEAAIAYPELRRLYAVPNGASASSKAAAGKRKAEGQRAGVLDIGLDVARGGWHGFRAELKAPGRKPTAEQLAEIEQLRADGYFAVWRVGWEPVRDDLLAYVAQPRTVVG
jgi:hypothetical protein